MSDEFVGVFWFNESAGYFYASTDLMNFRLIQEFEIQSLLQQGHTEISARVAFSLGLPA